LLLIPPDDEVIGCAVALRRAVAAGAETFGLYLTTSVPPPPEALWYWQRAGHAHRVGRRRAEAKRVAAALRLTPVGFWEWPSRSVKGHIPAALRLIEAAIGRQRIDVL
jgi:LmbE family N-acetylglucosaminyl deacetylase